jgi:hypothetical protein
LKVAADELAEAARKAKEALDKTGESAGASKAGSDAAAAGFTGAAGAAGLLSPKIDDVNKKAKELDPKPAEEFGGRTTGAFGHVIGFVKNQWPEILTLLALPFAPAVALATNAFGLRSTLTGALTALIGTAGGLASRIWGAIKAALIKPLGVVEWLDERIRQPITNFAGNIGGAAAGISRSIWAGFVSFVTDVAGWLKNRIIDPIKTFAAGAPLLAAAKSIGSGIMDGIKEGAKAVINAVGQKFIDLIGDIIGVVNKIPFVDIPKPKWVELAQGDIIKGPTMAVIGEDGPEAVIPLSGKRRKRGLELLTKAAKMMHAPGDMPGPFTSMKPEPSFLAEGGLVVPARATSALDDLMIAKLRGDNTGGIFERLADWAAGGIASVVGSLPVPSFAHPVMQGIAKAVRESAAGYLRHAFDQAKKWNIDKLIDARQWAMSKMGNAYLWGGGHSGLDFGRQNFDCSGFASHLAIKAGASSGIGTTSTTIGWAQLGKRGPMMWGWRGMGGGARSQHMGGKVFSDWYQFGNPGRRGGTDSQWDTLGVPPGLPTFHDGGVVRRGGLAAVASGETVLPAGRPPVAVHFHGPVIGGGDRQALGRELARLIEGELGRRSVLA